MNDVLLVVAPRFPSINQPWIDTYLEQLLLNDFEPIIFSFIRNPSAYQAKVDTLGLCERTISLSISRKAILRSVFVRAFHPRSLVSGWRVAGIVKARGMIGLLGSWMRGVHFVRNVGTGEQCQLVHSHAEHLAYDFLHLAVLHNIPLALTFHGLTPTGVGQLAQAKRKILYKHVAKVIVNTRFAMGQVCALGCDPAKVQILPQGLPLADFSFALRPAPPPNSPVRILTVGRYHRDKGQAYALIALRRLLDRGVQANWSFVGVGPDRLRLERLAQRLGLACHVSFLEGVPTKDLGVLYQECHLFVLPSITSPGGHVETQGVVLQEAQASGCIPIASRVGGIPECVNHQRDALLVREKSSRSIADAVQYLLARPEQWAAYQEAGRRNVEENYSADVIGQKMAALLRGVVESWTGYEGGRLR